LPSLFGVSQKWAPRSEYSAHKRPLLFRATLVLNGSQEYR
jgi:hypothetical protein